MMTLPMTIAPVAALHPPPPFTGAGHPASHCPSCRSGPSSPFDYKQFGDTWPFGLVVRGADFYNERQYLAELNEKSKEFIFGTHQVGAAVDMPQVVVMVIGESSRYDRWSINGYARETNPLLKNESNLVNLCPT